VTALAVADACIIRICYCVCTEIMIFRVCVYTEHLIFDYAMQIWPIFAISRCTITITLNMH